MDGVLVDMTAGVVDTVNTSLQKVRNGASTNHADPDSAHPGSKSKSQALRKLVKEMEKEDRQEITPMEFDLITDLKDSGDEGMLSMPWIPTFSPILRVNIYKYFDFFF